MWFLVESLASTSLQKKLVTVNCEWYGPMITNVLSPNLEKVNLEKCFEVSTFSRNCDIEWYPKSCDLIPSEYFLWGYVRSLFLRNNSSNLTSQY